MTGTLDRMTFHSNAVDKESAASRDFWDFEGGKVIRYESDRDLDPGIVIIETFGLSFDVSVVIMGGATNNNWTLTRLAYDDPTLNYAITLRCKGRVISIIRDMFQKITIVAGEENSRASIKVTWDRWIFVWIGEVV